MPESFIGVGSVRTLLEYLEKLELDKEHVYFYRGHDNFTYKAIPSIYRNSGWIKNEDILFKELVLRCPNDFPSQQTTFQALVRMQHYSLPTRLLDLTSNPLIALYFACTRGKPVNESGEILVYRVPKRDIKYFDSDTVSVVANISRRPSSFKLPGASNEVEPLNLSKAIKRLNEIEAFNSSKAIKFLLHEIRSEKPYFEPKIVPDHLESVLCVKPKMDNARIIRQDGAFFLFGISGTKLEPAKMPSKYFATGGRPRIIIKAEDKSKILQQLESLGITQGTIYPEIERVAEYIKTTYWEKTES